MTETRRAVRDLLRKGEEPAAGNAGDFPRDALSWLVHQVMAAEVRAPIGADRSERTEERPAQRNGTRPRGFDTRVGTLDLQSPTRRTRTSFPAFLEPRRRAEQAPVAVIAEAEVPGGSTRTVEALIQTWGIAGMSTSAVSRPGASRDVPVAAFRNRRPAAAYPYPWLAAGDEQVREEGGGPSMAVVVAHGVRAAGVREVLGGDIATSEHTTCWRACRQSLVARGLRGGPLVVSAAHAGLKQAIRAVCVGASWQRCRVHFYAHPVGACAPVGAGAGGGDRADALPAAGPRGSAGATGDGADRARGALPEGGGAPERGRGGGVRLLRLPGSAPPAPGQHHSPGAAEQGTEAAQRGGRHLPQPGSGRAAAGRGAGGTERRMGGRPARLQ